ncbi:MAG: hypothetical protein AB7O04_02160 [Hyphomonadaceae bacterium]
MAEILVVRAPKAGKRADNVTARLAALGYKVEAGPAAALAPHSRKQLEGAVAKAERVLVLWSKDAAAAPSVLAAAARAKAAGKLTLARLDAAQPPILLRAPGEVNLSAWQGRATRDWQRLLARLPSAKTSAKPAAQKLAKKAAAAPLAATADEPKKKGGAGLAIGLGLLALAAAGAAAAYIFLFA